MKHTFSAVYIKRLFITEITILFLFVFLINNYIGNVDNRITADGIGYYEYLPSIFIHKDFKRFGKNSNDSCINARIDKLPQYVPFKSFKVNKYPIGTSILQLPFFTVAYLITDREGSFSDGYQATFQSAMFYSALFYLFLSIVFLRKLLELYNIKFSVIIVVQLLLVFATPVIHYVNKDSAFSHVYSLFAITAFSYYVKLFYMSLNKRTLIFCTLLLGLIFLIRHINIIIILVIPFLLASNVDFVKFVKIFISKPSFVLLSITILVVMFAIQGLAWYLQTGSYVLYSYQGEGFNFASPMFLSILFSYKKGLFIYTPVLFFTILALIGLMYYRAYYLCYTFLLFFVVLTYALSSWHCWYYGCSYGLRAYVDYLSILMLPMALLLDKLKIAYRVVFYGVILVFIPVNVIQTYQYKEYILHWINMDKDTYWKVFLKTNEQYKGLIWRNLAPVKRYQSFLDTTIHPPIIARNESTIIFTLGDCKKHPLKDIKTVRLSFNSTFSLENDSKMGIKIVGEHADSNILFQHDPFLAHFAQTETSSMQKGIYDFQVDQNLLDNAKKLIVTVFANSNPVRIDSLQIILYRTP